MFRSRVVLNATDSSALRTVSLGDLREFTFDDSRGERRDLRHVNVADLSDVSRLGELELVFIGLSTLERRSHRTLQGPTAILRTSTAYIHG